MIRACAWALAAVFLSAGCGLEPVVEPGTGAEREADAWDDWSVLNELANGAYRQSFVRVSSSPYPSELSDSSIDLWVSKVGWREYVRVAPDGVALPGFELPVGTIVVRELVGPTGAVQSLTVLARGPDGYSPQHGDLWYGTLDSDAWPQVDEHGRELIGQRVDECTSCHDDRADHAYVFGVPRQYRRIELPPPGP